MKYFFMSFIDRDKNKRLGACIVKANSFSEALQTARKKKINPGGEVKAFQLSESQFKENCLKLNRLYSADEMNILGY